MAVEREIQCHDSFEILTLAKLCVLIANRFTIVNSNGQAKSF